MQIEYAHQEAAHDRPPRVQHHRTGIADHFGIAVFQAQGGIQQLKNARIHARQDGQFLFRIFIAEKFHVFAAFDKALVVFDYFIE